MTLNRLLGGIAVALLPVCLGTASAAPPKHLTGQATAKTASKAHHGQAAVKPPAVPSPTPAPGDTLLYDGREAGAAGVTLSDWGGGSVEDSTEQPFAKSHSLKVTTIDPYQGAKIAFNTPVALGDTTDRTRYLAFTLRVTGNTSPIAQPQISPNSSRRFRGQGRMGYSPNMDFQPAASTPIQNIHLILTLANGATTDLLRPLPESGDPQSNIDQWINLTVPVSALGFPLGDTASPLQSVTLAGDDYGILYIGQIKLTQDTTPITCFAGDDQSAAVGQTVTLRGSAAGGFSTLHYAWDFDAATPRMEQASGPAVTAQYPKPGDYKVTLTVSDLDGIKKPATSTTVIHVQ